MDATQEQVPQMVVTPNRTEIPQTRRRSLSIGFKALLLAFQRRPVDAATASHINDVRSMGTPPRGTSLENTGFPLPLTGLVASKLLGFLDLKLQSRPAKANTEALRAHSLWPAGWSFSSLSERSEAGDRQANSMKLCNLRLPTNAKS